MNLDGSHKGALSFADALHGRTLVSQIVRVLELAQVRLQRHEMRVGLGREGGGGGDSGGNKLVNLDRGLDVVDLLRGGVPALPLDCAEHL